MKRLVIPIWLVVTLALAGQAYAQDDAAAEKKTDLRAAVQNPVGALISVPLKTAVDFGAPNGSALIINLQPVIPVTVGKLNLINRIILPFISVPAGINGGIPELPAGAPGDGATGLGDTNYSLFLSPAETRGAIWGLGPSISLPTATDDQLGTGKWSAGPTGVVLVQPTGWTLGALARQLWSFAGDSSRVDVSQFLLQPFANFNLKNGWYLLTDMVLTANWDAPEGQRWTIPLGGGAGKLLKIGKQPVNVRAEAYYNVERPVIAPEWLASFTIQLLFPK